MNIHVPRQQITLIVPYLSLYPLYQYLLKLFICASSHIVSYFHLSCTKPFRSIFEHTTPPPNKNKRNTVTNHTTTSGQQPPLTTPAPRNKAFLRASQPLVSLTPTPTPAAWWYPINKFSWLGSKTGLQERWWIVRGWSRYDATVRQFLFRICREFPA